MRLRRVNCCRRWRPDVSRTRDEPRAPAGNQPFGGPQTRFNQPVSAERSFAAFSLPVDAMRRVAHIFGGKINDVLLAVVDGGVERYLASLGERPRQPLVAMCPVSMRDEGDLETTTKVATMFVPMARPRSGAARRLQQIIANSGAAKQEFRALSKAAALDYALIAFGAWFASHALGMEAITRPVVNLVISNVGGLPGERYLGESATGRRLPGLDDRRPGRPQRERCVARRADGLRHRRESRRRAGRGRDRAALPGRPGRCCARRPIVRTWS